MHLNIQGSSIECACVLADGGTSEAACSVPLAPPWSRHGVTVFPLTRVFRASAHSCIQE